MSLTDASRTINELSSAIYTATLKDENGTVIPLASIDALTLTLYDVVKGTIINTRNRQNVLNINNVTVHATSGLLTWNIQPADNPIVTHPTTNKIEHHRAIFELTYSTTKRKNHTLDLYVTEIGKVID